MSRIRPGWYVLACVTLYAVVVTVVLASRGGGVPVTAAAAGATGGGQVPSGESTGSDTGGSTATVGASGSAAPGGLWFPIPGAGLPHSDSNLPGAARSYRAGVSQGFDLVDGDVAVPVTYGAAVLAAADGQVIRADTAYAELDPRAWQLLLGDVADGADDEQLDELRGRQVWIRTKDGATLRYGHLSDVKAGVVVGRSVYRGQVIGFVGNSGTDDGVAGRHDRARLRFEVWFDGDTRFLGEGATPEEVRLTAASLFVGP